MAAIDMQMLVRPSTNKAVGQNNKAGMKDSSYPDQTFRDLVTEANHEQENANEAMEENPVTKEKPINPSTSKSEDAQMDEQMQQAVLLMQQAGLAQFLLPQEQNTNTILEVITGQAEGTSICNSVLATDLSMSLAEQNIGITGEEQGLNLVQAAKTEMSEAIVSAQTSITDAKKNILSGIQYQNTSDQSESSLLNSEQSMGQQIVKESKLETVKAASEPTSSIPVETNMVSANSEETGTVRIQEEAIIQPQQPEITGYQSEEVIHVKVGEGTQLDGQQLVKDLADKIIMKISANQKEFDIQLDPGNLGKIHMKIEFLEEGAHVLISCTNTKTMELLTGHARGISEILEANLGESTHIQVNKQEQEYWQQQKDHQGQPREQQEEHKKKQEQAESNDFLQQFRLGLIS